MFELNALPGALAARSTPSTSRAGRPEIPSISGASLGQSTSQYLNARPQKMPTDLEIHRARAVADGGLTGPPPAFLANLLEVQSDIRYVIRQMDAAREKASNERAVQAIPVGSGSPDQKMLANLNKTH